MVFRERTRRFFPDSARFFVPGEQRRPEKDSAVNLDSEVADRTH